VIADEAEPIYIIEPFDPNVHDRAAFSCGVDQVDNYFKKTANKLAQANNVRVFVMKRISDDQVIGFYATNAHAVDYAELPPKYARTRPGHGAIPAAYISMMGVDERFAGNGFGGDLLVDALQRLEGVSADTGMAVIMLDVLDCGTPANVERRLKLYESYGFIPLPSNPLRLFLPTETVSKMLEQLDVEQEEPPA
jgi:ribosomal protein S18 acetylase RimI-like enzyme